jgi:hypothetical protein
MESTYACDCGCNIEFYSYSLGWDMHFLVGDEVINFILSENKMVNKLCPTTINTFTTYDPISSWDSYINIDNFKTWGELWEYISANKQKNNVFEHLYNLYNPKCFNVPNEAELLLDYIN